MLRRLLALLGVSVLVVACGLREDPVIDQAAPASSTSTTAPALVGPEPTTTTVTVLPELLGAADRLLVVGDSLSLGAAGIGDLEGRLHRSGFDDVEIIAEQGRDPAWGLEQIEALDVVPSLVVVELGTNRSANPVGFAGEVDAITAALRERGAERIAWITPAFATDDRYQDKIDVLRAAAGIDVVAAWDAVVHGDPTLIGSDGLHPTEAGYATLARFLAETASDLAAT